MSPLGIRRRLLLVIVAIVAVSVALLLVGFNLLFARSLDKNARELLRSRATQQLALLRETNGHLTFLEAPDESGSGRQRLGLLDGQGARTSTRRPPCERCSNESFRQLASLPRRSRHGHTALRSARRDRRPAPRHHRGRRVAGTVRGDGARRAPRIAHLRRHRPRARRLPVALAARVIASPCSSHDDGRRPRGASAISTSGSRSVSPTTS